MSNDKYQMKKGRINIEHRTLRRNEVETSEANIECRREKLIMNIEHRTSNVEVKKR